MVFLLCFADLSLFVTLEYFNVNYVVIFNYVSDYNTGGYVVEVTKEGHVVKLTNCRKLSGDRQRGRLH